MNRYRTHLATIAAVATVVALAATANQATATYGQIHTGPLGLVAAGTFAAGLVLLARDLVHEVAGLPAVAVAIAAGGLASYLTAGPVLALASTLAFALAELIDLAVYTPLRRRGWTIAAILSGFAGAIADTFLFLHLAGFPIGPSWFGQLVVKIGVTLAAVGAVVIGRAVLRHTLNPASA